MSERGKFNEWSDQFLMSVKFREIAWMAWHAALATRKPYGYGIVDKDGNAESEIIMSESGANSFQKAMTEHTGEWSARGPFRVVELFYEDSES
jgi:hypothetical protein